MVFEHSSYRSFLKSVLAERKSKNSAYSLRALARDLDLHPSHLSGVYKGIKNLSLANAIRIAQRLELADEETQYFCQLIQYENATKPEVKETFLKTLQALNKKPVVDLNIDLFRAISDWYHIPIIEMTELDGFKFTPANVAKKLGISAIEAEVAIERLDRLELIEKIGPGRYRKVLENYVFKSEKSNTALRQFHKTMLSKAAQSLEEQDPKDRYIGSQTFSIDVAQLDEARALIDEFRAKLVALFDRGKRRSKTYHLEVVLFDLTNGGNKE